MSPVTSPSLTKRAQRSSGSPATVPSITSTPFTGAVRVTSQVTSLPSGSAMRSRWLAGPPERRPLPASSGEAEDFDRADRVGQEAEAGGVGRKPGAIRPLGGEQVDRFRLLGQRGGRERRGRAA